MSFSNAPYIKFDNVEVKYTDLVMGLRGISLNISQGEFVFLCGQTGSGKSTLLKLLYREIEHTKGIVMLAGEDLSSVTVSKIPNLRRKMGIVPQDFALLPNKRVWENVAYAMRAVGAAGREVRKAVPGILEQVNIAHRADAYPHQLSGGEQQRVAIARALINKPKLLLCDEPTANLDPEYSLEIIELLANLNKAGATILVASHDMMAVKSTRERIVRLKSGLIESDEVKTFA